MKKVLFLCFLLPIISVGQQTDSLKIRWILEKSHKAMDLHCRSIDYNLFQQNCNNGGNYNCNLVYKMVFDNDTAYAKMWHKYQRDVDNTDVEYFIDCSKDTAYSYEPSSGMLTLYSTQNLKGRYSLDDNYFKDLRNTIYWWMQPADTGWYAKILYEGVALFKKKPVYVIKQSAEYKDPLIYYTNRKIDGKEGDYLCQYYHKTLLIDTASYLVMNSTSFCLSPEQDTFIYFNTSLLNYKINTLQDIKFHPEKVRRAISYMNDDTCASSIVKDLQGKAPRIVGLNSKGEKFDLYKQKAKCYVLDFMYSNCGYCLEDALPFWKEMKAKYNNPDIQYLAIDPVDKMDRMQEMVKEYNINFPVIQDKKAAINYAIPSYPSCYILDENFNVIFSGLYLSECDKIEVEKILSSYHNKTAKQK